MIKMGAFGGALVAVLATLLVIRHTRAEEEAGRLLGVPESDRELFSSLSERMAGTEIGDEQLAHFRRLTEPLAGKVMLHAANSAATCASTSRPS